MDDHLIDAWPGVPDDDDDPLICLDTSDGLWPILEEHSISLPIADDDINDVFDASCVFLGQENSALAVSRIEDGLLREINDLSLHQDNSLSSNIILDTSNNPWPLLQENKIYKNTGTGLDSGVLLERGLAALAHESSTDKEILVKGVNCKTRDRNHRSRRIQTWEKEVEPSAEEGPVAKKQDHNAKEKARRKKINESYLALGSFLPDSRRPKRRWSAPVLIARVIEYIPELEKEIKKLTVKKNSMLLDLNKTRQLKVEAAPSTVSVHHVKEGEVVIQICLQRNRKDALSNLICKIEAEDVCIENISTSQIGDDRVCYHLHVQMAGTSQGADCIAVLREKVTSWLC